MSRKIFNVGAVANDDTGDALRDAFIKCQDNFAELYNLNGEPVDITKVSGFNPNVSQLSIQWALDNSPSSLIVVPAGSYTITSRVNLRSGKTLLVDRGATIRLAPSVNDNMFRADSIENFVVILDGTLDGNGGNQTTPGSGINGIQITSSNNFIVVGSGIIKDVVYNSLNIVTSYNGYCSGLQLEGRATGLSGGVKADRCRDLIIERVKAYDHAAGAGVTGGYGFHISGTADADPVDSYNIHLIGCVANNCNKNGFALLDCRHCRLIGCTSQKSISDAGGYFHHATDSFFVDCDFSDNAAEGLIVEACRAAYFQNCRFSDNSAAGVDLASSSVLFSECDAFGNAGNGYHLHSNKPSFNVWKQGRVANNVGAGILLAGTAPNGATRNLVEGVIFIDDQEFPTQTHAVAEAVGVGAGNVVNNCVIFPQQNDYLSLITGTEGAGHLANQKL